MYVPVQCFSNRKKIISMICLSFQKDTYIAIVCMWTQVTRFPTFSIMILSNYISLNDFRQRLEDETHASLIRVFLLIDEIL